MKPQINKFLADPTDKNLAALIKAAIKFQNDFYHSEEWHQLLVIESNLPDGLKKYAKSVVNIVNKTTLDPKISVVSPAKIENDVATWELYAGDGRAKLHLTQSGWKLEDIGGDKSDIIHDWFASIPIADRILEDNNEMP